MKKGEEEKKNELHNAPKSQCKKKTNERWNWA